MIRMRTGFMSMACAAVCALAVALSLCVFSELGVGQAYASDDANWANWDWTSEWDGDGTYATKKVAGFTGCYTSNGNASANEKAYYNQVKAYFDNLKKSSDKITVSKNDKTKTVTVTIKSQVFNEMKGSGYPSALLYNKTLKPFGCNASDLYGAASVCAMVRMAGNFPLGISLSEGKAQSQTLAWSNLRGILPSKYVSSSGAKFTLGFTYEVYTCYWDKDEMASKAYKSASCSDVFSSGFMTDLSNKVTVNVPKGYALQIAVA